MTEKVTNPPRQPTDSTSQATSGGIMTPASDAPHHREGDGTPPPVVEPADDRSVPGQSAHTRHADAHTEPDDEEVVPQILCGAQKQVRDRDHYNADEHDSFR